MVLTSLNSMFMLHAAFSVGDSRYNIRPFDVSRDQVALEEICKNVYGGKDYLPHTAASLVTDPHCCFMCITDAESDRIVAVGNAKKIRPGMAWLEAVRTCEKHRGKGLARKLTQHLVDLSKEDLHEVFTCTSGSNIAMRKVFDKTEMRKLHQIHLCSFSLLADLPGWGSKDLRVPQTLLRAINAEKLVCDEARTMKWSQIRTESELNTVLERVKAEGGIGLLPGFYDILSKEAVNEALSRGCVWKLDTKNNAAAVFSFIREEKIKSLRSKWVCSIATTSAVALDSAIWKACSDECLSYLGEDVAFALCFDGAVPVNDSTSSLFHALPLADDPCLLFGTSII